MKAVWLSSTYYLDDAVGQLSGNAERMLTRALAYCGSAESSGFVSERAIRMLGLPNPKKLVRELIDANILIPRADGSGWDFRSWTAWNEAGDKLIARQKADRERQARHRAAKQGNSRDGSRDTTGAADTKNHSYSSVDREKNRDKRDPIESGSNVNRDADITPEQRKRVSPSRNMSRDVTAPEESREEENSTYVGTDDLRNEREPHDVVDEAPAHIETTSTRTPPQPTSATRTVVRQVLGNAGYPRTTIDRLAVQVGKLAREGHPDKLIREALAEWDRRDNCTKPEFLPTVLADLVKASRAAPGNNGRPVHKMRGLAELAQQVRANEQAAELATTTARRELQ